MILETIVAAYQSGKGYAIPNTLKSIIQVGNIQDSYQYSKQFIVSPRKLNPRLDYAMIRGTTKNWRAASQAQQALWTYDL